MNGAAGGFWGTIHWVLDLVGRGTVWVLVQKPSRNDDLAYAVAGGATTGATFGAIVGYLISAPPRNLTNTIVVASLGCLLGVCMGISFGAFVEVIDSSIKDFFNSLNSK